MPDNFFVLTGGPGAGKTRVIQALSSRGFAVMPEAGRGVIQHQLATGGNALPWADRARFAERMLAWDRRSHAEAAACAGAVFFDRGLPDIIGYLALCGLPVPADMRRAARGHRYASPVFAFPHWPEIYAPDAERRQHGDEAEATFHAVSRAYLDCGYQVITVPKLPVAQRADFILSRIG